MEEVKIYAAGKFLSSREALIVTNPFNGKPVARTFKAGPEILDQAIEQALAVKEELQGVPSWKRYKALKYIADFMENKKDRFVSILCRESGKPWKYALGEIDRAIQTFTVAAEEARRLPKEYIDLDWTEPGEGKEGIVRYFPVGLVAGISPFNFPMNLAVHKIAPAIAAGCPIILKPSSSTPLSALALARAIDGSGLPRGAVSVLPMSRETGNRLVTGPQIDLLSFTGSPEVGWKMKAEAGKKKVILELGGNAGVVVTETADLDHAVNRCLQGAFAYSGQVCIHAQRIYVHENIFTEFSQKFVSKTEKLRRGDPEDPETDVSVMIDEDNARRVEAWVNEAVDNGAQMLTGGNREDAFYPPTVLTGTAPAMKVRALEIFGPVVTLEPWHTYKDAITEVNDSRYGLQAGVFTNRIDEMDHAFHFLNVGGVIVNDVPGFRVDHMPYGGNKDSGLGREGVKYAIRDMLQSRILVKYRQY